MSETTEHPTLSEFLLARIAEDEALLAVPMSRRMIGRRMVEIPIKRLPAYVERDRARWAAECEAKRRIVDLWYSANREASMGAEWPVKQFFDGRLSIIEAAVRMLALPYADHADYREEWRP